MQNIFDKYKIYGRKKGKKKIKSLYKNLYKNYLFDLNTNLKNKKIIIDIGSGNGENSLCLWRKPMDYYFQNCFDLGYGNKNNRQLVEFMW